MRSLRQATARLTPGSPWSPPAGVHPVLTVAIPFAALTLLACAPMVAEDTLFGCSQQEPACPEDFTCDFQRGLCVHDRCQQITCQPGTTCDLDSGVCRPTGGDTSGGDSAGGDSSPGGDTQAPGDSASPSGDLEYGDDAPGDTAAHAGDSGPPWSALADGTRSSEICSASEQCPVGSGGGLDPDTTSSRHPALTIDGDGKPIVAWQRLDGTSHYEIYLLRWDGAAWIELAGSASGGGISNSPSVDSQMPSVTFGYGLLVVTWQETTGTDTEIYCKAWNGTVWFEYDYSAQGGGVSANTGNSEHPRVVLRLSSYPLIAWQDNTVGSGNPGDHYQIQLRSWTGSSWTSHGDTAAGVSQVSAGGAYGAALALHPLSSSPIVAWTQWDGSDDYSIMLRMYNGTTWVGVDGSDGPGGLDQSTSVCGPVDLVTRPDGSIIVVWQQTTATMPQIAARQYNSTSMSWEDLGPSRIISTTYSALNPRIGLGPFGYPIVTWQGQQTVTSPAEHEVFVSRYNGAEWTDVHGSLGPGGVSRSDNISVDPAIAVSSATDRIDLAWIDELNQGSGGRVLLRRTTSP